MDDLSKIPEETRVKIRLAKPDIAELMRIIATRIDAGTCHGMADVAEEQSITMTYSAWESVLKDLTAYAVEQTTKGATIQESIWRAKTEIEHALIGLQEERIMRMEQGEG